jgi:hypothetical protein
MSGSQQRHIDTQTATVDANGVITFVFSPPPVGMVFTGSMNVPNAAVTNKYNIYLGAAPVGESVPGVLMSTTLGASSVNHIQVQPNEYLVVQGTGQTPGTVRMAVYHAVASEAYATPLTFPWNASQASDTFATITGPVAATITGNVPVVNATGTNLTTVAPPSVSLAIGGVAGAWTTSQIPSSTQALLIQKNAAQATTVTVIGQQTGLVYAYLVPLGTLPVTVQVDPGLDLTYLIETSITPSIWASSNPPNVVARAPASANLSVSAFSGTTSHTLLAAPGGPALLLDSIAYHLAPSATAAADNRLSITVPDILGQLSPIYLETVDTAPVSGVIPFGGTQITPAALITCAGNSSSTAFDLVSLVASYRQG